jgi:uncharacterized protein YecE (DUF72 family)
VWLTSGITTQFNASIFLKKNSWQAEVLNVLAVVIPTVNINNTFHRIIILEATARSDLH